MAVTRITVLAVRFPGTRREHLLDDLHLLPGDSSIDLAAEMEVEWETEDPALPAGSQVARQTARLNAAHADVTVRFAAGLEGLPHAHGVTFDAATGRVIVDAPLAPQHVFNFLVKVQVRAVLGGSTIEIWQRIHVHQRVSQVWLTPQTLSVPEDIQAPVNRYSFTILARFEDGATADITDWPRGVPPRNHFAWTTNRAAIGVDPDGTIAVAAGEGGHSADVTLTYQRPGEPALPAAPGRIVVLAPWSRPQRIEAVRGAAAPLDGRVNILLLSEGLVGADLRWFWEVTDHVVGQIGSRPMFDPWKSAVSAGTMQFWRLFLPSFEAGFTVSDEVVPNGDAAAPQGSGWSNVPAPKEPSIGAAAWSVEEMIHEVGLPSAELALLGDDELRDRLAGLYGAKVTEARIAGARAKWKLLARRTLLNDRNSVLGLRRGRRPRAQPEPDLDMLELDPRRLSRQHLAWLLINLELPDGTAVGNRWGGGIEAGRVGVFARGYARPRQVDELFTLHPDNVWSAIHEATPRPGLDVRPSALIPVKDQDPAALAAQVVHEGSHALGLGDEYGDEDRHALPDGALFPERYPNLHALTTVGAPAPMRVSARNVKWGAWQRIRRAAVLRKQPTVTSPTTGTVADIEIDPGQVAGFAEGKPIVRLRTRIVRMLAGQLRYITPIVSAQLRVTGSTATSITVVEESAPQGQEIPLSGLASFLPEETILFIPRRGRLAGGPDGELPVLAPVVARHIDSSGGPADAPLGDPTRACAGSQSVTQYPSNLPSSTDMPCYRQYVVGLYEGGNRYLCGVFHPGGICMMREEGEKIEDDNFDDLFDVDGPFVDRDLRRFCFVCRYALIEVIDPTLHGRFDDAYEDHYPN